MLVTDVQRQTQTSNFSVWSLYPGPTPSLTAGQIKGDVGCIVYSLITVLWLGVLQICFCKMWVFDDLRCWYGWAFSDSSVCQRLGEKKKTQLFEEICGDIYVLQDAEFVQDNAARSSSGLHTFGVSFC